MEIAAQSIASNMINSSNITMQPDAFYIAVVYIRTRQLWSSLAIAIHLAASMHLF